MLPISIRWMLSLCLEKATSGKQQDPVENPAVTLAIAVHSGECDDMPDEEYGPILEEAEKLARLWNGEPSRPRTSCWPCRKGPDLSPRPRPTSMAGPRF